MKTAYCQLSSWDEIKAKILFELPTSPMRVSSGVSGDRLKAAVMELANQKGFTGYLSGVFIDELNLIYPDSNSNELKFFASKIQSEQQWNELIHFLQELGENLNCDFSFFQGKSTVPIVKLSRTSVQYDPSQLPKFIADIEVVNDLFKQELFKACLSKDDLLEFERKLYLNKVLQFQMDNPFVFSLLEFNYKQSHAVVEFRKLLFQKVPEDEFLYFESKALCKQLLEETSRESIEETIQSLFQIGYINYGTIHCLASDLECFVMIGSDAPDAATLQQKNETVNEVLSQMEEYEEEMDLIYDNYTLEGFESFTSPQRAQRYSQATAGSFTYAGSTPKRNFFKRYWDDNVRNTDWKSTLFLRLFFILLVVMFTNRRCHRHDEVQIRKTSPVLEEKFKKQIDLIRKLHNIPTN